MSRQLFAAEKGVRIYAENSDSAYVDFLFGSGAPGGDAGVQDDAPVGSMYFRTNGTQYQKIADTNAPSDWQLNGASAATIGHWRSERIVAVTNGTVAVGTRDLSASPFPDDDSPLLTAADFVVGDFIIADADGTPVLREVTAVSAPNVTFAAAASPLVAEDTFVALNYLPDTPGAQEGRAIVNYNGSVIVKLADIDWAIATGINLSGTYAAASGNVAPNDTVEAAIAKLDGVNDAQDTLLGRPQGSTNLGASSVNGNVVPENATVKQAIDALDDAASNYPQSATSVSSNTTLDTALVDVYRSVAWLVTGFDEANPSRAKSEIVHATNNGTASADATQVDDNTFSKNSTGNFNFQVSVDLNGTGASQTMRLRVNTTEPDVTFTAIRLGAAPSGY